MNRRRVAEAKSHRASPEELREAKKRIKEIEEEMRQIELQDATKHGEEREQRYDRMVRLREMREEFLTTIAAQEPAHMNSLLLALVMFVSSFLLCGFCAFSGYFGLTLINQTPDPTTTGSTFWTAVEQEQYSTVENVLFSPTLRAKIPSDVLILQASTADQEFGKVNDATLSKQSGDGKQSESLTYAVTRTDSKGKKITYQATLLLTIANRTWVIDDPGAAFAPTQAGVAEPTATPGPTPTPVPTQAPTPTDIPTTPPNANPTSTPAA